MAEEKIDQPTKEDPQKTKDGTGSSGNGDNGNTDSNGGDNGSSAPTQTPDEIQNYIEDPIEKEIEVAKSRKTVACIGYRGKIDTQEYKLCLLFQGRKVHNEYFGIKNTLSTALFDQTTQIKRNVDAYLEKAGEIQVALNNALDAIKESKTKILEIKDAACKLDAARNDSCNSEQLSAMKGIPEGGEDPKKKGIKRFQFLVTDIVNQSNSLYTDVDNTFEKGVKVAGILAFMNISGLDEFSSALKEDAEKLDADVDNNLKDLAGQVTEAQGNYTAGLQGLDEGLFEKNNANLTIVSLEEVKTYSGGLKTKPCVAGTPDGLENIYNSIKSVLQEEICKD